MTELINLGTNTTSRSHPIGPPPMGWLFSFLQQSFGNGSIASPGGRASASILWPLHSRI